MNKYLKKVGVALVVASITQASAFEIDVQKYFAYTQFSGNYVTLSKSACSAAKIRKYAEEAFYEKCRINDAACTLERGQRWNAAEVIDPQMGVIYDSCWAPAQLKIRESTRRVITWCVMPQFSDGKTIDCIIANREVFLSTDNLPRAQGKAKF